ncbi:MAG: hypothetical protein MUF30_13465 [Burkholderiales bacterium]|jgi:hypothetical protein|nr:hypothetical protein [Burkholderiales bacterium]
MTPEDLARQHPLLHHLTEPDALDNLHRFGLLPASTLLDRFDVPAAARVALERRRRPERVRLEHPQLGHVTLNDNQPLTEKALVACLDDGMTPEQWLLALNARVFFWPTTDDAAGHLAARFNRGRDKLLLSFDTLALARAHAARIELAPINTGSTIRKPARRGRGTFTPLGAYSYAEWRRLRGGHDRIREVTVVGGVPDVMAYAVAQRIVRGGEPLR